MVLSKGLERKKIWNHTDIDKDVEFMQKYSNCFWRLESLLHVTLSNFWKGWGIGDDWPTSVLKKDRLSP